MNATTPGTARAALASMLAIVPLAIVLWTYTAHSSPCSGASSSVYLASPVRQRVGTHRRAVNGRVEIQVVHEATWMESCPVGTRQIVGMTRRLLTFPCITYQHFCQLTVNNQHPPNKRAALPPPPSPSRLPPNITAMTVWREYFITCPTGGLSLRLQLVDGLVDGPQGLVGVERLRAGAERTGQVLAAGAQRSRHRVAQHVQYHLRGDVATVEGLAQIQYSGSPTVIITQRSSD